MTIDMTIVINQFFLYPRSRTNFFRGHKAIDRNGGERYRPTEHTMVIFIDGSYIFNNLNSYFYNLKYSLKMSRTN